ncbi:hypothetical protein BJ970_003025 [Saccharopolyspora phatthalungensis]|uniref:Uncharacterized protein n=1 Tax=Saccharopolyspora phatthalungensis TaxID=664693 RepID=A0A840Q707_9PSEU|nr:hypothetical protein [Saccharopolyspora phatthalungensis]
MAANVGESLVRATAGADRVFTSGRLTAERSNPERDLLDAVSDTQVAHGTESSWYRSAPFDSMIHVGEAWLHDACTTPSWRGFSTL